MGGQAKGKKKNKTKRKDNHSTGGLTDLSPKERVKLRMHEKAKKKTAEKYSVLQLLEKTEECMDSFDFEMASRFCQRALDVEPTHLQALDILGHICSELGDRQKAKEVFLRAVEMSPNEGHSKYMSLGQIHTGQEAVGYYNKGLEILLAVLEKEPQTAALAGACAASDEAAEIPTARDVCVAYCSVAEIYLTDLCMEEGAADKCRESIERALHYHHDNPEALQLMASYLFSAEKNQEGKDYLMRSVAAWLPAFKQAEASLGQEDEPDQNAVPIYGSRITTAKLLIETEEFETAVDVLEGLLEEDDEVVQMEKAGEQLAKEAREATAAEQEERDALREAARSYLTRAKKLYSKMGCDDQAMLEHFEQLLGELGGEVESDGEQGDPALAEDYEPCSDDDDDDDDEDGNDAPMEH